MYRKNKLRKSCYLIFLFTALLFRISFAQTDLSEIRNKVDVLYQKAEDFDKEQKYDSSYVYYGKAAPLFEKLNDSVKAAKCYINLGVDEYYYGNPDKALENYYKANLLLKNSKKYNLIAKVFNNIAVVKKNTGNYEEAISYYHKSIDLKEKINDTVGIANTYNNIGVVYLDQKEYNQALKCFEKASDIFRETDKYDDLADIYANIGLIYGKKEDVEKSLLNYNKAIELYSSTKNKYGKATVLLNKAILLLNDADHYSDAENLFLEALQVFEELKYKTGVFTCKINLSRLYSLKNEHRKAVNLCLEAFKEDTKTNQIRYLSEGYNILSKNYFDLKDYKSAYVYLKKYVEINDSIFNLEKNKQINEIRTKYETDKKEKENLILKQEAKINRLELEKKDKKIITAVSVLVILIISLVSVIIMYLQKRRSYLDLVRQNVELAKRETQKKEISKSEIAEKKEVIQKLKKTKLSETQKKELLESIVLLMEEEKYYLNEQFTVRDFAKEIGTNRNYLSQIINEFFNTNFTNFVNEYRVKEARKLLLNPEYQNYSLEGIAKTCGFHSKATFNTAFKKFTGVTPSFFKKNAKSV